MITLDITEMRKLCSLENQYVIKIGMHSGVCDYSTFDYCDLDTLKNYAHNLKSTAKQIIEFIQSQGNVKNEINK